MDSRKRPYDIRYTLHTIPPALLCVGERVRMCNWTENLLVAFLCATGGCGTCISCRAVVARQHHALLWLRPEKNYTVENIDEIFSVTIFELGKNQHFFFVLEDAHCLTQTAAHKLLKLIEEPPSRYHFIFLTHNSDEILPTIRSRCTIYRDVSDDDAPHYHPIFHALRDQLPSRMTLCTLLETHEIHEHESLIVLDALLTHWINTYKRELSINNSASTKTQSIVDVLLQARRKPPMPGSSVLFWKSLYLAMHAVMCK